MRASGVLLFLLFSAPPVARAGAISGLITNGTMGRPQPGVEVTLIKLQGGMVPVGQATTDAQGRYRFDAPPPSGELPFLLRATYGGVSYHAPARGSGADLEVNMEVFDTTSEKAAMRLARHQVVVEPRPGRLLVGETYTLANEAAPRKAFVGFGREKETFRFHLPGGQVEDLQVMVSGPRSIPVRQNAVERGPQEYALDYPWRPGESRVEVNYRIPYGSAFTFRKPAPDPGATAVETTIVAPLESVTLKGAGLTPAGRDESQGAQFYRWSSASPLEFEIAGVLPESRAEASAGGEGEVTTVENPNFVFQVRWKILTVVGVALALGLAHLYRLGATPTPAARASRK